MITANGNKKDEKSEKEPLISVTWVGGLSVFLRPFLCGSGALKTMDGIKRP
jgi:hypothetical protein